jgi:NAD(P)H-dependent flavin oxidoreductase YrpB (nitropropane dioxygenase family)
MKSNRLCQVLGIRYPIVQAPMNWITGAELAAAVSNAGGLGTLGPNAGAKTITRDVEETGERLRLQIRKTKSLTNYPFAVNFPIGLEGVEGEGGRAYSKRCVEVALEEGIKVAITSVGAPNVYTKTFKDAGVKVLHAVSTAKQAKKAEDIGVDAVICEGNEGGGHKALNGLATIVLVPMVADVVNIPVLAGGGIADARGMVAALALGADGVYMGTRFIATLECDAHPKVKVTIIRGADIGTVSINKWVMEARDLQNNFTTKFMEMRTANASSEEMLEFMNQHSLYQALVLGDADDSEIPCGENAGLINRVISTNDVVSSIINNIPTIMEKLKNKLA